MSYILDALKKSEQERKQGDVPNLQTIHIPVSSVQQTSRVLYGFIVILLLALAFVIGLMMSNKEPQAVVEQSDDAILHVAEEKLQQAPVRAVEVQNRVVPVLKPKKEPKAAVARAEVSLGELSEIPYLHELPDYQQESIPQMIFAGHVFSSSASNRSVIINGYAMSEGDTIVQSLNVEQITPSGVVFRFKDELFRMDILQDWSFE